MATNRDTTKEHVRPAALVEELRAAGVDNALTIKVFECVETERAQAITKAARLFYLQNDGQKPLQAGDFADQFSNMKRRIWGLVAALEGAFHGHDDLEYQGVRQLAEDTAREMERLSEAFSAERWLAREVQS